MELPKNWPMFCMDIKQEAMRLGNPELPPVGKGEHDALADALWNRSAWVFLRSVETNCLKADAAEAWERIEERSAIMEFDGGLTRELANAKAFAAWYDQYGSK